jgi:ribonuclease J
MTAPPRVNLRGVVTTADPRRLSIWAEREIGWVLENRWSQLSRSVSGTPPEVDWMGVQREVEVGLQRRLRRELQVEPLIICLVQPSPAGTPAYKGRADSEPDSRPAPRLRRDAGREPGREPVRAIRTEAAAAGVRPLTAAAAVVNAGAAVAAAVRPHPEDAEPSGRVRRRRSAALAG